MSVISVCLAEYGERLISRSEAKRVLAGLDKFTQVLLDFQGVKTVGPSFADEVFRVYAHRHPHITLTPLHAAPEVQQMISRAEHHV